MFVVLFGVLFSVGLVQGALVFGIRSRVFPIRGNIDKKKRISHCNVGIVMLKRRNLGFLFHGGAAAGCLPLPIGRGLMALNKQFCTRFFGSSQMGLIQEKCGTQRKCSINVAYVFNANSSGGLNSNTCLDHREAFFRKVDDGIVKERTSAAFLPRVYDPKMGLNCSGSSTLKLEEDTDTKLANVLGAYERGSPLRFPDRLVHKKLIVAVDIDEVLGSFLSALNKFIADRYSLNHSVSEYYVYEFFKIWNCSRIEADIRVHEFFKTSYFKTGIHPIPGAQRALLNLSEFCNMSIVTSRQNAIKEHTIEWIEMHYPGLFQEIHFGNHFALDGKSRPKSEICRSLGAQVLIDDNPRYALECAEAGIKVLLFDFDNSYPWCKTGTATVHPLVTKVHNWPEVEQHLVSWILS